MLTLFATLVDWINGLIKMWHDKSMRDEGRAQAQKEETDAVQEKAQVATDTRAAVAADVAANPDVLRDDDGFKRAD